MTDTDARQRMRSALRDAMKARDTRAVSALRSTLAAIDDAEAVPAETVVADGDHVAGAAAGVGAADVTRRELTGEDVTRIVHSAVAERRTSADDYDRLGQDEAADALRYEADVLAAFTADAESARVCDPRTAASAEPPAPSATAERKDRS